MNLFTTLAKNQKRINFRKSDDYFYFDENRALLNSVEMYRFLYYPKNEFDVIRANTVIRSIKNKKILDDAIEYAYHQSMMKTTDAINFVHETMTGLPYIQDGETKIYVPIFSKAINLLYFQDYGRLLKAPYNILFTDFSNSCIDLFETYSFSLYDSMFTKLITVYKDEDIMVSYHYDYHTLYVINNQGRLDVKIALFDKYMRRPVTNHIVERVKPVIDAYIKADKDAFLNALLAGKLISNKLFNEIKSTDFNLQRKKLRKINKK